MKTGALPKQVDLRGLAARGSTVTGTLSPATAKRLMEAGVALAQPADAVFECYRDDGRRYRSYGHGSGDHAASVA